MRWAGLAAILSALIMTAGSAAAQVKIGVLTDMTSDYADISGKGSIAAAQMAAKDFGPVLGGPVEIVSADHQNSPDLASGIARRWYDAEGVDLIVDGSSSRVALAVEDVSRQRHKLVLFSGAASTDITGQNCSAYAAHWTYDSYALASVAGRAIVGHGGRTWFMVSADYAFGRALQRDTAEVIKAEGGEIVGSVYAPFDTSDFSPFLLQAKASKADIIGFANAGGDTANAIKQGAEFALAEDGRKIAALFIFTTDIHAIGLETAQGVQFVSAFYWDKDDDTRAFSRRFLGGVGHVPTMIQAGIYSATMHYL